MKCKEVLDKYHKLVPFPISPEKIEATGYNVSQYLGDLSDELELCDDYFEHPLAQKVCRMVNDLRGTA